MTDRQNETTPPPMCVRVWLEVGHACEPRTSAMGRALALDWRVWVRGAGGEDISSYVHKVVFYLHPSSAFVYPKRVIQEPPFEIQESGCASIEIPIHVYLKYSTTPKKIRLKYSLRVENNSTSSKNSICVHYDIENPSEQLWRSLMKGGGEIVARAAPPPDRTDKLVILLAKSNKNMKAGKCTFVEPLHRKHGPKKGSKACLIEDVCPKCDSNFEFEKQLRSIAMTEDEIERVSRLYLSYKNYEKSVDALLLPPLSDPIYRPELPASLRGALSSIEADYAMQ